MLDPEDKLYEDEIELRPLNAPQPSITLTVGEFLTVHQNDSALKVICRPPLILDCDTIFEGPIPCPMAKAISFWK